MDAAGELAELVVGGVQLAGELVQCRCRVTTVGTQLAIDTGQPVQIENRAGGNTALGAIEAARAPADGYTVLSTDNGTLVFNPALYRNLSYDPARDFADALGAAHRGAAVFLDDQCHGCNFGVREKPVILP
mgnify:CR=1 FL=1